MINRNGSRGHFAFGTRLPGFSERNAQDPEVLSLSLPKASVFNDQTIKQHILNPKTYTTGVIPA